MRHHSNKTLYFAFRTLPILSWIIAAAAFGDADLLVNSGFEDVQDSMPEGWKVFVAPQPGATGELDSDRAFEGGNSVQLHIPTPYAVEPANNWSQPLPLANTGVRVRVKAQIKTNDATEAAIWLQCFQRDPWMVLKQVSSSIDSPVYGTMDWTPVEFEALVPRGTDYAMIRCVLKGHGTAWFDNVSVELAGDADDDRPKVAAKSDAVAKPVDVTPPEPESISPLEPKPVATEPPAAPPAPVAHTTDDKLRESNEILAEQLQRLQTEIAELRAVMTKQAPEANEALKPPPLVPHGYRWEEGEE